MQVLKSVAKFVLVGNATVLVTLLLLPVFLITDHVDVFNTILEYLWKEV